MTDTITKDLIIPKFAIGDTIYVPGWTEVGDYVDCPDCLGAGMWPIKSPAGEDHEIICPRCRRSGKLRLYKAAGIVSDLTVGSIKTDTHPHRGGEYVTYMCRETGIGSGSLYDENKCFSDRETAQTVANLLAAEQTERVRSQPAMKKLEELYSMPTVSASLREARAECSEFRYALEDLKEKIIDLPDEDWRFNGITAAKLREISIHLVSEDDEYRTARDA